MRTGLKPSPILLPAGWLFGALMGARNAAYATGLLPKQSVRARVVSVGNLTAGGTGKTPFVEYIVRKLLGMQKRVAIVSRGYGRTSTGPVAFGASRAARGSADMLGDELFQIGARFPDAAIVADGKRERGAQRACDEFGADVIVLDDGFQRQSLKRDLDIVLVDASVPLRPMAMIPAGFRREPLSGIRRADVLAYTRVSRTQQLEQFPEAAGALQLQVLFEPVGVRSGESRKMLPADSIRGKKCLAFCGVGNPDSFRTSLTDIGANMVEFEVFPDHDRYEQRDVDRLGYDLDRVAADVAVTTEKDMARLLMLRLPDNFRKKLYVLEIETKIISGEAEFLELLRARVG